MSSGKKTAFAKTAARIMAVQASYGKDFEGDTDIKYETDEILKHLVGIFNDASGEDEDIEFSDVKPDRKFFKILAEGINSKKNELDEIIVKYLKSGWSIAKLDTLLKSILRAGVYEMTTCPDIPTKVIINEYLNITRAFFDNEDQAQIKFVNALLDQVGRNFRKVA